MEERARAKQVVAGAAFEVKFSLALSQLLFLSCCRKLSVATNSIKWRLLSFATFAASGFRCNWAKEDEEKEVKRWKLVEWSQARERERAQIACRRRRRPTVGP